MKYFTIQWWADHTVEPQDEYKAYLESIFSLLPTDLQKLSKEVSLHDARLRTFNFDAFTRTLRLELNGHGFDKSRKAYFKRKFSLVYEEVRSINSAADPETGLPGPHGYGDLGYDEVEILAPRLYEHRTLFSTGIEIHVQFSSFSLFCEDKK